MSREVVILSAARTPVGRYLGTLGDIPAWKLGSIAIAEAVKRAGVDGAERTLDFLHSPSSTSEPAR